MIRYRCLTWNSMLEHGNPNVCSPILGIATMSSSPRRRSIKVKLVTPMPVPRFSMSVPKSIKVKLGTLMPWPRPLVLALEFIKARPEASVSMPDALALGPRSTKAECGNSMLKLRSLLPELKSIKAKLRTLVLLTPKFCHFYYKVIA